MNPPASILPPLLAAPRLAWLNSLQQDVSDEEKRFWTGLMPQAPCTPVSLSGPAQLSPSMQSLMSTPPPASHESPQNSVKREKEAVSVPHCVQTITPFGFLHPTAPLSYRMHPYDKSRALGQAPSKRTRKRPSAAKKNGAAAAAESVASAPIPTVLELEQLAQGWCTLEYTLAQQRIFLAQRQQMPQRHNRRECVESVRVNFPLQLPLILRTKFLSVQMEFELFWVDDVFLNKKHAQHPQQCSFVRLPKLPVCPPPDELNQKFTGPWRQHVPCNEQMPNPPINVWFNSLSNAWGKVATLIRGKPVSAYGALKFCAQIGDEWVSLDDLHKIMDRQLTQGTPNHGAPMITTAFHVQREPMFRNPDLGSSDIQLVFRNDLARRVLEPYPACMQSELVKQNKLPACQYVMSKEEFIAARSRGQI